MYSNDKTEMIEGDYDIDGNCLSVRTYDEPAQTGEYERRLREIVIIPLFNVSRINIVDREEESTRGLIV